MMLRGKLLILLTVIMVVAFATNEVKAQDEDCYAADSVLCGKCTLTAVRDSNGEFPVPELDDDGNPTGWYKVEYEYSGTLCDIQGFDHVYFALEYNECHDAINVRPQEGLDYYDHGQGGGDNDLGLDIHTVRVLRISPQGNKAWFYVDTNNPGKSSSRWSAGRKQSGCDAPIISVGYDPLFVGPLTVRHCLNLYDTADEQYSVEFLRDRRGCIVEDSLTFYDDTTCTGNVVSHRKSAAESGFVYSASAIGGPCAESITVTKNSPICLRVGPTAAGSFYYIGPKPPCPQ